MTINIPEYSVSSLSTFLKRTVEDGFSHIRLKGEILGYRGPHSSGHLYFSLKDEAAKIDAIMWKWSAQRLKIQIKEGMEVIATGKVTTFEKSSKYQIVIENMEVAGEGALLALLEERKRKLLALGLFDEKNKQQLPFFPKVIGVITSPTGAVLRDIWRTLLGRFPTHLLIHPAMMQGETCSKEVKDAVAFLNNLSPDGEIPRPDVIIIARGGGSVEDLWGFNDEELIYEVAKSKIPIISAIGHETDWTLLDYVADVRASTPTGAAEMASPKLADLFHKLQDLSYRKQNALDRYMQLKSRELANLVRAFPNLDILFATPYRQLDMLSSRLSQALVNYFNKIRVEKYDLLLYRFNNFSWDNYFLNYRQRLNKAVEQQNWLITQKLTNVKNNLISLSRLLDNLSYLRILDRGFALILDKNNQAITRGEYVAPNSTLKIKFADKEVMAIANPAPKVKKNKPSADNNSLNLFND